LPSAHVLQLPLDGIHVIALAFVIIGLTAIGITG
jgi:hypothetical protein